MGAQGEIYRGVHRASGTPVALKVRSFARGQDKALAEFRQEVRAVARLRHPGIVRVHDQGVVDAHAEDRSGGALLAGSPYLVMDLADGSLRRPAEAPPLRPTLTAILDALAHAHAHGVLHRDLKPANVLTRAGRIVLADFGLAHVIDDGEVGPAGTPLYMPPEQFDRDASALGPWSDLYAVGWLAWVLTTGAHPWARRPLPAQIMAHKMPERPSLPGPWSEPFKAWVDRLVHRDPGQRYRHAADAAHDLAHIPIVPDERAPGAVVVRGWRERLDDAPIPGVGMGLFALREQRVVGHVDLRDRLWARLTEVTTRREARGVLLRGAAGLGKSRLARWLCERADELGLAHDLRMRCAPQVSPDAPYVELLGRALRAPGALDGVVEADAHQLRQLAGLADGPAWFANRAERLGLIARWMAGRARERPLILWIDDLPHAPDLVTFVEILLREPGPILVVATAREETLGATPRLRERLDAGPLEALHLGPLPPDTHRDLVARLLGLDSELVERVAERTAGNPLFAVHLVGDWVSRGILEVRDTALQLRPGASAVLPADVRAVWVARLQQLQLSDDETLAVAAFAALDAQGPPVPPAILARLPAGRELWERLLDQGLAIADELGHISLVHGMLRESVLHDADTPRAHHLAAEALADHDARQGQRGLHRLYAGEPAMAAVDLCWAARDALDAHALPWCATLLDRLDEALAAHAADPKLKAEAVFTRGRLRYWHGDLRAAEQCIATALAAAIAIGDANLETRCHRLEAELNLGFGRIEAAVAAGRAAVRAGARSSEGRDPYTDRRVLAEALLRAGGHEEAYDLLHTLLVELDGDATHLPQHAATLCTLGSLHRATGEHDRAIAAFRASAEAFEALHDRGRAVLAHTGLGDGLRHLGALDAARVAYARALELAEVLGTAEACLSRLNLGLVELASGRHDEALPMLRQSRAELAQQGFTVIEVGALLAMLAASAGLGDTDGWAEAWAGLEALDATGPLPWADPDLAWPARLAARLGRAQHPAQAEQLAILADDQDARLGDPDHT